MPHIQKIDHAKSLIFQWDDDGGYISGGWKEDTGTVSGLVGFGKALSFEDGQVAMNDINIQMGCTYV